MKQIILSRISHNPEPMTSLHGANPCYDRMPDIPADRRSEFWIC